MRAGGFGLPPSLWDCGYLTGPQLLGAPAEIQSLMVC